MNFKTNILTKKEDIKEFLANHRGEIKGLYEDRFYKNGGHNGTMNAISEVEKRYNTTIDMTDADCDLGDLFQEVQNN